MASPRSNGSSTRFKLDAGLYLTITPAADAKLSSSLPVNEPVPLVDLLANRVELQDIATRSQIAVLARYATDPNGAGGPRRARRRRRGERSDATGAGVHAAQVPARPPRGVPERQTSRSRSSWTCSRRSGPVTTRSRPRPSWMPRPAASRSGWSRRRPGADMACSRALLELPAPTTGRHAGLRLHPQADDRVQAAGEPASADDHGRPGHGRGSIPGVPPGSCRHEAAWRAPIGESILFFGCRDPLQDFIYEDELRAFEAEGVTRLSTAFSRDPGQPKRYVQHAIEEQGADVWRLLQDEATIFVCGDASRMAPDVRQRSPGSSRHRPVPPTATPRPGSPGSLPLAATSRTSGPPATSEQAERPCVPHRRVSIRASRSRWSP